MAAAHFFLKNNVFLKSSSNSLGFEEVAYNTVLAASLLFVVEEM